MKRTKRFNIRLSKEEYNHLCTESKKIGLSQSDYFRVVLMRKPMPSATVSKELLAINADLARLGNLLKLCIQQIADTPIKEQKPLIEELNNLKNDIRGRQAELKIEIMKIST